MARPFPRFLYSNPQNTKSKGPFVIHTMEPFIICSITDKPAHLAGQNFRIVVTKPQFEYPLILLNAPSGLTEKIDKIMDDMQEWAKHQILSGVITF